MIVAALTLGGGKRVLEGLTRSLEPSNFGARVRRDATFVEYRVKREPASTPAG